MASTPLNTGAVPAPPGGRLLRGELGYLLFVLVGIPLCCFPLMQLQGLRLTAAPLFYLLVAQRWGFARGAIAALVLNVPGLVLWGISPRPLLALGQVWFVCRMHRRGLLMAEATILYDLIVLPAPILAIAALDYASIQISILALTQYVLAHVLLAATADVLRQNFTFAQRAPFMILRANRSLEGSIRAMINFVVALLFCVAMINQAESITRVENIYRAQIRGTVSRMLPSQPGAGLPPIDKMIDLELYDQAHVSLYVSDRAEGFERRAAERIGPACSSFVHADRDGAEFADILSWNKVCEIAKVTGPAGTLMTAASIHRTTALHYAGMSKELIILIFAGLFALAYRVSLTRALHRTMTSGVRTITRFGEPNLPMPARQPFGEFDTPLRRFVELNNNFVATVEERDRLAGVARGLNRSIELRLMRAIRFEPETGMLRFEEIRITEEPIAREVRIHPADHPYFVAANGSDEAMVEFRVAGNETLETYLVTLRESDGALQWETGIGIRLRQPQRLHDLMLRQARLVDLGNMATAITHEVKQPLFTIAMAAESIRIILEKRDSPEEDEALGRCVARIGVQVERAREIIRRISHYSHVHTLDPGGCDAAGALEAALSFLQPLLDERRIEATLAFAPGVHWVGVSRIALEQVMVNAIQNAADAILSARHEGHEAGELVLSITREGDRVHCAVTDDGIGVAVGIEGAAFEPFFTTKSVDNGAGLGLFISRQIVTGAGGTIALVQNGDRGATLLVTLPIGTEGTGSEAAD